MDIAIGDLSRNDRDLVNNVVEDVLSQLGYRVDQVRVEPTGADAVTMTFVGVERVRESDEDAGDLMMAAARADLRDSSSRKLRNDPGFADFLNGLLFDGKKKEGPEEEKPQDSTGDSGGWCGD